MSIYYKIAHRSKSQLRKLYTQLSKCFFHLIRTVWICWKWNFFFIDFLWKFFFFICLYKIFDFPLREFVEDLPSSHITFFVWHTFWDEKEICAWTLRKCFFFFVSSHHILSDAAWLYDTMKFLFSVPFSLNFNIDVLIYCFIKSVYIYIMMEFYCHVLEMRNGKFIFDEKISPFLFCLFNRNCVC